jgi:hypothetical protein
MRQVLWVMLLLACAQGAVAVEHEIIVYDGVEYKILPGELKFAQDDVQRHGKDKDKCISSLKWRQAGVEFEELVELDKDQRQPKQLSDRLYCQLQPFGQIEYLAITNNRYAVKAKVRDYGSVEINKAEVKLISKLDNSVQKFNLIYHEEYLYLVDETSLKGLSQKVSQRNVILTCCFGCKVDDPKRMVEFQLPPQNLAGTKPGEECDLAGVKLCWCPAGKFTMGSPAGEAER